MTTELVIMQGDQYALPVELLDADDTPLSPEKLSDVEIVVGSMRKTLSGGEIKYSEELAAYLFPLTQAETFALRDHQHPAQVRVKSNSGEVVGHKLGSITVVPSTSKEIL